jgi:hypothetical protein
MWSTQARAVESFLRMRESTRQLARAHHIGLMAQNEPLEMTLKQLRDRRERIATELASLEPVSPAEGGLTARELVVWRTRLAELESRIARHQGQGA